MKLRVDYVSNSSSASFIVRGSDAAKTFYDDFGEFLGKCDAMGETMRVSVKVDDDCWDCIDIDKFASSIVDGNRKWEDVKSIYFSCDDYDSTGIMYLQSLYMYFEKLGFNPDDSDSERGFRLDSRNNNMILKLMKKIGELNHED